MLLSNVNLTLRTETNEDWGVWTGLQYGDQWLCNSVEHASWVTDPVAPWACWHCGQAWGCCAGGLAHVVRTDRELVWMPPYYSTDNYDPRDSESFGTPIDFAVIISRDSWDTLAQSVKGMPNSSLFPAITNHDLVQLWLQERPDCAVPRHAESFVNHLCKQAVASHPLEIADAIAAIERVLDELAHPARELSGVQFRSLPADADEYNTMYFFSDQYTEFISTLVQSGRPVIANRLSVS